MTKKTYIPLSQRPEYQEQPLKCFYCFKEIKDPVEHWATECTECPKTH